MRRFRNAKAQRSYHRVLLAVYWLSEDGLVCGATNREIADAAGLAPDTVKSYLYGMWYDGELERIDVPRFGNRARQYVIVDHEDAQRHIEILTRRYGGVVYEDPPCSEDEEAERLLRHA